MTGCLKSLQSMTHVVSDGLLQLKLNILVDKCKSNNNYFDVDLILHTCYHFVRGGHLEV